MDESGFSRLVTTSNTPGFCVIFNAWRLAAWAWLADSLFSLIWNCATAMAFCAIKTDSG